MLTALITNIKAIARHNVPSTRESSTYFDRTWGKNTAFQKNTTRTQFDVLENNEGKGKAQINDQILVMYKTDSTASRSAFLSKMAEDSVSFLKAQATRYEDSNQKEKIVTASMSAMVEHLFEILKSYGYEVNNAVGFGPMHLASTNPQMVTEVIRFNSLRQAEETVTHFRARLSTSRMSLVVRGNKSGIEFFILPVARAMGLSRQEASFQPVARLTCRLVGESVEWEDERGLPLDSHRVETICMETFSRLLEATREAVIGEDPEFYDQAI